MRLPLTIDILKAIVQILFLVQQKNSVKIYYSVMQSHRNSLKTDIFHKPTIYELHVYTCSEQKINFATREYGRVGVFRIEMR